MSKEGSESVKQQVRASRVTKEKRKKRMKQSLDQVIVKKIDHR